MKIADLVQCNPLMDLVERVGLRALAIPGMPIVDHDLISAFVERWHAETSSFHLPFGEMTITLDDVSCLMHLPVGGAFYTPPRSVTIDDAAVLAHEMLGIPRAEAVAETLASRGPYFRFQKVIDITLEHLQHSRFLYAARSYLLLLLGFTIFASKHFDRVDLKWLFLFEDLDSSARYAWGPAALVFLYDQLNFAAIWKTKQCGGYAAMLMAWIYEHFPTICPRRDVGASDAPRFTRWSKKKTDGVGIQQYRERIDALSVRDVIWRPFEDHRDIRPLDPISLFRGYLHWGDSIVAHMPDRCARQFGFSQGIPAPPLAGRPRVRDVNTIWMSWAQHVSWAAECQIAPHPDHCTDDYLEWFGRVSVPRLLGPGHAAPAAPADDEDAGPADDEDAVHMDDMQERLTAIVDTVRDVLISRRIRPGSKTYRKMLRVIRLAGGGTDGL